MSRLLICLPALDHGDASSHFVILIARAIRALGGQTEILAPIIHPKMRRLGHARSRFPTDLTERDRILLVHSTHSVWPGLLDPPPAPTHLLYQGLTPPELCGPQAAHLMGPLQLARQQLTSLAPRLRGALCTSHTVARELEEITGGQVASEVIPLAIDESIYPLDRFDPDRPVGTPPRLLSIGRVVPHKRIDDMLSVLACLQRTGHGEVHLDIVGDAGLCPEHTRSLQAWAVTHTRPAPMWWGKVPFKTLTERLLSADALLITSAHEGFCVPLLEAMWLGVPIVAVDTPGVVETLGDAGLIARGRHIEGLAGLVEMVLTDTGLRRRLIEAGRQRAQAFGAERLTERLRPIWERWR